MRRNKYPGPNKSSTKTHQEHFLVGYATDDQLPVGARALSLGVVNASAHRYFKRNGQVLPDDFVAGRAFARNEKRPPRKHAAAGGKVHEHRGRAALADAGSAVHHHDFELAQGRADAVEVVAAPRKASAWALKGDVEV